MRPTAPSWIGVIAFTEAIIVAGSIVALHCDLRWRNKKTAEIREDVIVTIYIAIPRSYVVVYDVRSKCGS